MSAFAHSIATIFRDPNMSRSAVWRSGGEGAGSPVRVILRAPDRIASFGEARVVTDTFFLDVQVSQVAALAPGDTFTLGDGTALEVRSDPVRDRERLCWAAEVREL